MALLSPFKQAAARAVAAALGVDAAILPVTTPPDPKLGDYAVACFPAAKALKANPAQLAQKVVAAFLPDDMIESVQAAGPYVNVRVRRDALVRSLLESTLSSGRDPIPTWPGQGKTVCIDFSSPNIAKQLAYHHIRSTVIGRALVNIHRALGWKTVGINHLGDWGTTFGMLLSATQRWGVPEPMTIAALNDMYVRFRAAAKQEPALEEDARAWFKKLEDGDPTARALWQRMRDVSLAEFQEVYDLLGVTFDSIRGESDYESLMPQTIAWLEEKGLTSISEDALVVDLSDRKMPPLLLRKKDGATLYATRDLAAARYRKETYHFDRSLYVVARDQALHFAQMKAVLEKAGVDWAQQIEHVSFGLVRIAGKKTGTRIGNVVLLKEVLAEAQEGTRELLRERGSELANDPERMNEVARIVGIGAVLFANLVSQREKDVDFNLDQVISLDGDAGPYVQYGHARIASILRRAGISDADTASLTSADVSQLRLDEEWALARLLTELGDETARAAESDDPHVIARYLLDVCGAFSRWYTLGNQDPALKILTSDPEVARARIALAAATRVVLRRGLGLLGIEAPDVM
jgi:arginyl-tRNA synthetase